MNHESLRVAVPGAVLAFGAALGVSNGVSHADNPQLNPDQYRTYFADQFTDKMCSDFRQAFDSNKKIVFQSTPLFRQEHGTNNSTDIFFSTISFPSDLTGTPVTSFSVGPDAECGSNNQETYETLKAEAIRKGSTSFENFSESFGGIAASVTELKQNQNLCAPDCELVPVDPPTPDQYNQVQGAVTTIEYLDPARSAPGGYYIDSSTGQWYQNRPTPTTSQPAEPVQ